MGTVADGIRGNRPAMAHFAAADLSVYLYTSSDRLILYVFTTPTIVGLYDAAYRLIQPFYGIATVASDTYYSRLANRASPAALQLFREYVDFMFFATIPLGFFTTAFATLIIGIVYGGDFAAADGYLAILGWAITFGFISGAAAFPFTIWNMPRQYNSTVTGGASANLVMNLLLIPPLLGTGAALATVGGKVAATAIGLPLFHRASSYPILRDALVYGVWSAIAFVAGILTMVAVGDTVPILGPAIFAVVYVSGISWQRLRYHLSPIRARARYRPIGSAMTWS